MRLVGALILLVLLGCGRTAHTPAASEGRAGAPAEMPDVEDPPQHEEPPTNGRGGTTTAAGAMGMGGAPAAGGTAGSSAMGGAMPHPCAGVLELQRGEVLETIADGLYALDEELRVTVHLVSVGGPVRGLLRVTADHPNAVLQGDSDSVEVELATDEGRSVAVPYRIQNMMAGSEIGFMLTLANTGAPSCQAAITRELEIVLGQDDSQACEKTRQLEVSAPYVVDTDDDGKIEPGETFMLMVTLTNAGPLDHNLYPGATAISNHPGVKVGYGGQLYAMGPGQSYEVGIDVHVDPDVPPGTQVDLTLTGQSVWARCRHLKTLDYSVLIE